MNGWLALSPKYVSTLLSSQGLWQKKACQESFVSNHAVLLDIIWRRYVWFKNKWLLWTVFFNESVKKIPWTSRAKFTNESFTKIWASFLLCPFRKELGTVTVMYKLGLWDFFSHDSARKTPQVKEPKHEENCLTAAHSHEAVWMTWLSLYALLSTLSNYLNICICQFCNECKIHMCCFYT